MNRNTVNTLRFIAGEAALALAIVGLFTLFNKPSVVLKVLAWIGAFCIAITQYSLIKSIENEKD